MNLRALIRRWLYVEHDDEITKLNTLAVFPADPDLERRIQAAREGLMVAEPRKLIEDQPTTFKQPPIDWDGYA